MDRLISRFDNVRDGDVRVCEHRGVAYLKDMTPSVQYDDTYFNHYAALEGTPVAVALNEGRCAILARHAAPGASVWDVGAGCGTFIQQARRHGYRATGFDINPRTVRFLTELGAYSTSGEGADVVSFWDSLEHIPNPESVLQQIKKAGVALVAVPIIDDLKRVRESKHFKPGEHLYYWTRQGFIDWMALYGFRLIEESDHEVMAGRVSIGAFAFCRDLPDYKDHIEAYKQMHHDRFYGSSATELHLDAVATVVSQLKPTSILDFGCGRSDLVAHFWRDGERRIGRYDPAIRPYRHLPNKRFDLVLCCDVMEHIPMAEVDLVLTQIRDCGSRVFFSISIKPARAKLPDGRNAHVTLLTREEWARWIKEMFGQVQMLHSSLEHELVMLAGTK